MKAGFMERYKAMTFYSRKSPRIPNYDYSSENYYFITICAHEKRCIFGSVNALNTIGLIVSKHIEQIQMHYQTVNVDKYVVMPNHVHLILYLDSGKEADTRHIIGQFKSGVSREVRKLYPDIQLWQRSFHDHVIRNQADYERIWLYIEGNPLRWEQDCFFMELPESDS